MRPSRHATSPWSMIPRPSRSGAIVASRAFRQIRSQRMTATYTARQGARHMKSIVLLCALVALPVLAAGDRWEPVRFMLGHWQGDAQGEPGKGTVERSYELVLADKFIEEHNTSRYEARDGKPPEVHHHRSFFSYDKTRQVLMMRQFHEEGFVLLYVMSAASTPKHLVFD